MGHSPVARDTRSGFPPLSHSDTDYSCSPQPLLPHVSLHTQVLLVTGGWNGTSLLATTEILLLSSPTAWTVASALPRAVEGPTAASLPGQLYVAGGWDGTIYRDEVRTPIITHTAP